MFRFRTGNGADWLDLLATKIGRYQPKQVEMLSDHAALQAWLGEHGMEPAVPVAMTDVEAAHTLREAMHRAAAAAVRGEQPSSDDVRVLQDALQADRPLRVHRSAEGLHLERPAATSEALGRLARQAVTDLTGPTRARLHACGDETCAGIFLDYSGRRRWCSDERCGVRTRVRAHRARARDLG